MDSRPTTPDNDRQISREENRRQRQMQMTTPRERRNRSPFRPPIAQLDFPVTQVHIPAPVVFDRDADPFRMDNHDLRANIQNLHARAQALALPVRG